MTEPKISLKGKRKRRSIKFPFEDKYPIIKTIRKELGITDRSIKRMEDDLRTFGFLPEVDKDGKSYGVIAPGFIPDANINGLLQATKQGLIKNDVFVNAYEDLAKFFSTAEYTTRLQNYFKSTLPKGLSADYTNYRVERELKDMAHNMLTAKPKVVKKGNLGEKVGGRWNSNDNTIEVVEDRLHSSVPKHELIHASDEGKSFLDNANYRMRPIAEKTLVLAKEDLEKHPESKVLKKIYDDILKDVKYFGDDAEQRPRVINTIMDMKAKGFPINKLTQADVDEYFDVPVETLPSDTQSLLGNYIYEDILPALQNFKTVATPFVIGATGYGVKRRLESNGQKSK